MQSDANNPMDKWLDFLAKKRREKAPSSWEMPKTMQDNLLQEIQKNYPPKVTSAFPQIWLWLTAWRRLAWVSSFLVIGIVSLTAFWMFRSPKPIELAQSTKLKESPVIQEKPAISEPKTMESRQLKPSDAADAIVADAPMPTTTVVPMPSQAPTPTARTLSKDVPTLMASNQKSNAPNRSFAQRSAARPLNETASPKVALSKETLERYALRAPPKPESIASSTSQSAGSPLSVANNAAPNSTAVLYAKISPEHLPETAIAPKKSVRPASQQKLNQESVALLERFSVERIGDQIVIIDQDGSQYAGRQWPTTMVAAVTRTRTSTPAAPTSGSYGRSYEAGGAGSKMRGSRQLSLDPVKAEKPAWCFQAVGTNLITRQPVIVEGSFFEENTESSSKTSLASAQSQPITNALPAENRPLRMKIQVQIGTTNLMSFEAKPAP